MAVVDPQERPNPNKFNNLIADNYELALDQSMQDVLDSNGRDSSAFTSNFYQLMQARADPPLETLWFYSALTFRGANSVKDEPLDRVSAIKDLFQLISGCAASLSSSKCIALLAPVIYEVYRVMVRLKGKDLGFKKEKKLMREIRSLVKAILGFISLCCSANEDGHGLDSDDFIRPLQDLIRLWVTDHLGEKTSEAKEGLKLFFPLLSDYNVQRLTMEGHGVSQLAGVVMLEAFLLRLCLDFRMGDSKVELQKELRSWAIGSITGFQHFDFFEALVRMLLERTLPVTSLLSSEHEVSLRNILYDAVILVEYTFLRLDKVVHMPAKRLKDLGIARMVVTHEAIELYRRKGNLTKAISYTNAFSSSKLPSQLIKLVTSVAQMESKDAQPKGFSPKALLKWLLNLEDRGIRLLDDGIAKYRSKLALDISEAEREAHTYDNEGKKSDADIFFYIDNKGEGEDGSAECEGTKDTISAAFVAAAHKMTSAENGRGRKRKEGRSTEKKGIKFLKYNLPDNFGSAGEKSTFLGKDESSSGSEVEDPLSDEDVEDVEK